MRTRHEGKPATRTTLCIYRCVYFIASPSRVAIFSRASIGLRLVVTALAAYMEQMAPAGVSLDD